MRISVRAEGNRVILYFPYNESLIQIVRSIPGRHFDAVNKTWSIPISSLDDLKKRLPAAKSQIEALERKFHGPKSPSEGLDSYQLESVDGNVLFPHQLEAVEYLIRKKRCILADDTGVGKSISAIAMCEALLENGEINGALIVCPASIKETVWGDEIEKWTDHEALIVGGTRKKRGEQWEQAPDRAYVVINYELLRNDFDFQYILGLTNSQTRAIVLDEGTRVKNYATKTAQAAKQVQSPYRYVLTGTPMENRPEELYSLVAFLHEDIFGTWRQFQQRYIIKGYWGGVRRYINLDDLRRRILYLMLRRKKDEIPELNLPPMYETTRKVKLSAAEKKDYKMLVKELNAAIKQFDPSNPKARTNVMAKLTICRMYLLHPDLVRESKSETAKLVKDVLEAKTSSKMTEMLAFLKDTAGPVVVFTRSKQMAFKLRDAIPGSVVFSGSLKMTERKPVIDSFQRGEIPVLISTDAGKFGVTLTAANVVVHYDEEWNPATMKQRSDRIHRITQTRPVTVVKLIVPDSDKVEAKVRKVLDFKEGLVEQVIG